MLLEIGEMCQHLTKSCWLLQTTAPEWTLDRAHDQILAPDTLGIHSRQHVGQDGFQFILVDNQQITGDTEAAGLSQDERPVPINVDEQRKFAQARGVLASRAYALDSYANGSLKDRSSSGKNTYSRE
jgi:hypothetical protein